MNYVFADVIIDDERTFDSVKGLYLRNSKDALYALSAIKESYDRITTLWLDHDLGMFQGKLDTTMVIVDYLCELSSNDDLYPVDRIHVHTQNPPAALAMMRALVRYEYHAMRVPLPN